MKEFKLDFSNRIIEHLGVKLYQNKPTNVVAEFVSNAWDADATNVEIDLKTDAGSGQNILITDNGVGMTRDEITDHFLIIGRNRRKTPNDKSLHGRFLMGRKGIGKLAGFGIAGTVDIISVPNPTLRDDIDGEQKCFWLRFLLQDIIAQRGTGSYLPAVIADGVTPSELQARIASEGNGETYEQLLNHIQNGKGGVSVRLSHTTTKRAINPETLLNSMGRRFTVTMLRPDFVVKINSNPITPEKALPPLQDFRFGKWDQLECETVTVGGIEREIRYWIGFVKLKDQDWSIENAGVGVYAHGKIVQDQPFFFGVKGKEILSRYMYGVIEADWLDELPEDVVSTDRRSVDWSSEFTADLHEWGEDKLTHWLSAYRDWRLSLPKTEIVNRIREHSVKLSATEEEALADLLTEVFTDLGNNEEAKNKTTEKITSAWTHEPTRKLTQTLWKKVFSNKDNTPDSFISLMNELQKSLVPEAMGLAVTMSQRIAAITAMHKMIEMEKTETHLQRLIEQFPWLIAPQYEFLTANQTLRTLVEKKHIPDQDRGGWTLTKKEAGLKPDFVFLSDPSTAVDIVVFELKGPECGKTLQPIEYDQLSQYLTLIERTYNNDKMTVSGILIGHDSGGFKTNDVRIKVRKWADVLLDARILYVSYLEALLQATQPDSDDARMKQIADFGGVVTQDLLGRYASLEKFPAVIQDQLEADIK